MSKKLASGLLALCALAAVTTPAAARTSDSGGEKRWIVVLGQGTGAPDDVAREHGRSHGAQVDHVYRHALRGYSALVPDAKVDEIRGDPRVAYLEPDHVATVTGKAGPTPAQQIPWGILRVGADISPTALAGDGSGEVAGVHVYVVDTGIDRNHPDLRVVESVNFAGGSNSDCNGHGTHVAGTIAARDNSGHVVGVAPGAALHAVKVLGCNGSGLYSAVIAGVDWVTANAARPAVANMSLGGPISASLDAAVVNSAAQGIVYAVAAGNEAVDACSTSPARVGAGSDNGVVTVGAVGSAGTEASFSNHGSCVDLWAPGVSVLSTWPGGKTKSLSGTSMASPHVAGGAALLLARASLSPADVELRLKADGIPTDPPSRDGRPISILNVRGY